jgi:hypothetical protein
MVMKSIWRVISAFLFSPAVLALAQQAQQQPKDVLIGRQSSALVWIVGIGLLICTLIAGFKHPGRTHLS